MTDCVQGRGTCTGQGCTQKTDVPERGVQERDVCRTGVYMEERDGRRRGVYGKDGRTGIG